jgi:hypothetical protein
VIVGPLGTSCPIDDDIEAADHDVNTSFRGLDIGPHNERHGFNARLFVAKDHIHKNGKMRSSQSEGFEQSSPFGRRQHVRGTAGCWWRLATSHPK